MVASVLVVEDDNDLAGLIVDALRREGYAADMVENGANAISQVAERPPDAVILDLRLPDMTVWTSARTSEDVVMRVGSSS